jgi:multidrug efflux pump subunit AcrA (membrane-fusion protein)
LAAAEAKYRDAVSHPTESELKAAESAVAQAESALTRLDPAPEALALAQAQVDQAQAALDLAQSAAQDAILVAPFDGTVAAIPVDVGQVVAPGTPVMTFGNLAKLEIETTDLAEADVIRVALGQPVKVTLDALPDQILTGQVTRIAPIANDHSGDKVFKMTVSSPGWNTRPQVDVRDIRVAQVAVCHKKVMPQRKTRRLFLNRLAFLGDHFDWTSPSRHDAIRMQVHQTLVSGSLPCWPKS